mmetsp:Transcript_13444/g.22937  ORF Transcript_13444/g.22937 Transcript_13444/m.22937 type:complete len:84 (-) Transcript_13444:626-877(-)
MMGQCGSIVGQESPFIALWDLISGWTVFVLLLLEAASVETASVEATFVETALLDTALVDTVLVEATWDEATLRRRDEWPGNRA